MRFTFDLKLGNEAMQTTGDIARALRQAADELDRVSPGNDPSWPLGPTDAVIVGIRDGNGNRVGEWAVTA